VVESVDPPFCHASAVEITVEIEGTFPLTDDIVGVTLAGVPCRSFTHNRQDRIWCQPKNISNNDVGSGPVIVTATSGGASNTDVTFTYLHGRRRGRVHGAPFPRHPRLTTGIRRDGERPPSHQTP